MYWVCHKWLCMFGDTWQIRFSIAYPEVEFVHRTNIYVMYERCTNPLIFIRVLGTLRSTMRDTLLIIFHESRWKLHFSVRWYSSFYQQKCRHYGWFVTLSWIWFTVKYLSMLTYKRKNCVCPYHVRAAVIENDVKECECFISLIDFSNTIMWIFLFLIVRVQRTYVVIIVTNAMKIEIEKHLQWSRPPMKCSWKR